MSLLPLVFLFSASGAAPTPPINFVGYEIDPFYYKAESSGVTGACFEIIQEICDREKILCKFKIIPMENVVPMLESGEADLSCPIAHLGVPSENISSSDKIFKTRFALYALPKIAEKINTPKNSKKVSFSVYSPQSETAQFEKFREKYKHLFSVVHKETELSALQKAERVGESLAYVNKATAQRWIQKSKSQLVEIPLEHEESNYYITYSNKKLNEEKRDRINQVIKELKSESYIQKIALKYDVEASEIPVEPSPSPSVGPTLPIIEEDMETSKTDIPPALVEE